MISRTPTQLRRAAGRLYDAASRWRKEAPQHAAPEVLLSDARSAMSEGAELEAIAIWIELKGKLAS